MKTRTFKKASAEIRECVVKAYLNGTATQGQLAAIFGYTVKTINNWVREFRDEQRLAPRPAGHYPAAFNADELLKLQALVEKTPDMTLKEIRDELGKQCSLQTISTTLLKLAYSFQGNSASQRTRQT